MGWVKESNSFFHAMIQIEGFLTCFVAGFLMTAFPRFLGAPSAAIRELVLSWGLEFFVIVLLIEKRFKSAEIFYLAVLTSLIVFVVRRLPKRTKSPPSSFLLIGFGLLQAITGPVLMMASGFGQRSYDLMEIGRQMLQIGFMLSLVLGIAGYLAPFLMGYASDPSCDPQESPIRGTGIGPLLFHGLSGALIMLSFIPMTTSGARAGAFVRAGVAFVHLMVFAKIARPVRNKRAYVYFFWISCWMIFFGLLGAALWPDLRIACLHLIFISGFSLMIFSFGLMVVLSHGAQAELLNSRLIPLKIAGVAVLVAAGLRVTADIDAWNNRLWLHMASGTWVLAAGLWLIYIFPKLYRIPPQLTDEPHHRQ